MEGQSNSTDFLLARCFKELAATKSIEKITVKEITDKAGVIRPTFYNHFKDKYDLMGWIAWNELFVPAETLFNKGELFKGINFVLSKMAEESAFYQRAVMFEGQNDFNEMFNDCTTKAILKYIELGDAISLANYPWLTKEMVAQFYSQCISYIVIRWVKAGMKIPANELADVYVKMFQVSLLEITKDDIKQILS